MFLTISKQGWYGSFIPLIYVDISRVSESTFLENTRHCSLIYRIVSLLSLDDPLGTKTRGDMMHFIHIFLFVQRRFDFILPIWADWLTDMRLLKYFNNYILISFIILGIYCNSIRFYLMILTNCNKIIFVPTGLSMGLCNLKIRKWFIIFFTIFSPF